MAASPNGIFFGLPVSNLVAPCGQFLSIDNEEAEAASRSENSTPDGKDGALAPTCERLERQLKAHQIAIHRCAIEWDHYYLAPMTIITGLALL